MWQRPIKGTVSIRLSSGCDVLDLLRKVLLGFTTIEEMTYKNHDVMTVTFGDEEYWVLDGHKRLWVLQALETMRKLEKIKVKVRKDHRWREQMTCLNRSGKVQLRFSTTLAKKNFHKKLVELKREILERNQAGSPPPAHSRFFTFDPLTVPKRLEEQVDRRERLTGILSWNKGPYKIDYKIIGMILLILLLISMSVINKNIAADEKTDV
ncbi:unnamed protein product [Clavelina lepadiformis]|uniref:Uncharacterized protein n=1 Tax=Clavelina lepadiformis TaxID=159417 RepID=A0ABP0EXQ5_CLALP